MLMLAALVATAAWSYVFAQQIPVQRPISITKSKGSVRMECNFKDVSGNFDSTVIHWYQQKANKGLERVLYFSGSKVVDDGFQRNKYLAEKISSQKVFFLTINDVIPDDTATYYCAYWYSHCDKESSPPVNSEILQKKHKDQTIYVCLIEKFYPEVIQVTWADEQGEIKEDVVKGDPWQSSGEDDYSISSWLTVKEENKGKKYECKYQHEAISGSVVTQDSSKPPPQENCTTYPGNGTVFNRDHLTHRTAYLVYIVLLLKSSMYYLIVLFFIYRMWAPTKHQGKKA